MTDKLRDKLIATYPPILNFERVYIYGACERICLNLMDFCFDGNQNFNDHKKIEAIARQIFDVPFIYKKKGDIGPAVFFEPRINDAYHQNYTNHFIQVHLPCPFPQVTLSTGNRGAVALFDKQRENYFQFVNEVFEMFKEIPK